MTDRKECPDFETLPEKELDIKLRQFYAEVRNRKGDFYSKSSLLGIRASLNRHLRGPPYYRKMCLVTDQAFNPSNHVFIAMIRKIKRLGKDTTSHIPTISDDDLSKILSEKSFDLSSPLSLQQVTWFNIHYNFARRGRENDRLLTKDSFIFETDSQGKEYAKLAYNEKTKNHQGATSKD